MISGAMTPRSTQSSLWSLVRRQHGVIARRQLVEFGFSREAIRHRVAKGRLRPIWPDVYAVGRPDLTQEGVWMAATLTCGEGAVLSHQSAAELWGIRRRRPGPVHVSVPSPRDPRRRAVKVHRRRAVTGTQRDGIPVTTPAQSVIDIAPDLTERQLERVIDEADKLDLLSPKALREAAAPAAGKGAAIVRGLLDKRAFLLTDSDLERRFLKISRTAGLEDPETQVTVNGHRVDFFFRAKNLVVEADGGRYHRTPTQQRRDRIRDHAHALAETKSVRFTHGQIAHEPDYVAEILRRL